VAGMQQIEAAVREDHAAPRALFRAAVSEKLLVGDDFAQNCSQAREKFPGKHSTTRRMNAMNRASLLRAAAGLALVAAGAAAIAASDRASRPLPLAEGCPMPARELGPASGRTAVILHGLAANERIMEPLGRALAAGGWRVILVDLPGHGRNPEPFSFAREEACARAALAGLARSGAIAPPQTVLIGHSLGGALAARLAEDFPAAATIAISPAPVPPLLRPPANLLVISASFDLAPLKAEAARLARFAGGHRTAPEDFSAGRAVALVRVAPASHTSLIFDPRVWRDVRTWADRAVPAPAGASRAFFPLGLLGAAAGFLGLLLLFPLAVLLLARPSRGSAAPAAAAPSASAGLTLLRWAAAGLAAVLLLAFLHPEPVRMFAGDYFASFAFLTGLALVALIGHDARRAWRASPAALAAALGLGCVTVVVFAGWLDWRLTEAWLIGARWWRAGVLAALCWPYFYAEEAALGPPGVPRRFPRFLLFLLLRLELWLALLLAFFVLASSNVLLVLLANYFLLFSILQRLAADLFRRERPSPPAAALFDAILAGWFFATIFPLR
jgi:pimeloyl-ACP methyl ester carboxylesterase